MISYSMDGPNEKHLKDNYRKLLALSFLFLFFFTLFNSAQSILTKIYSDLEYESLGRLN